MMKALFVFSERDQAIIERWERVYGKVGGEHHKWQTPSDAAIQNLLSQPLFSSSHSLQFNIASTIMDHNSAGPSGSVQKQEDIDVDPKGSADKRDPKTVKTLNRVPRTFAFKAFLSANHD